MGTYIREEIVLLPSEKGPKDGYVPILYRPNSRSVIPSAVRYLDRLSPKTSSETSWQISQRNIALLKRRIDAVGDLDPRRILKCYGYRFGDKPFMMVALTGKETLSRIVERDNLSQLNRLKLLYETGKAIQYLHSRSPPLVHGAVHPKNIFVDKHSRVVLSDFGLAVVWREMERDLSFHASSGQGASSVELDSRFRLGYTAPEYLMDEISEMLPAADVFGLASVILAVLSDRHPYSGVNIWSPKAASALRGEPPSPMDHPNLAGDDSLWPLLNRMWSHNPKERPNINEVIKELDEEIKIRCGEPLSDCDISGGTEQENMRDDTRIISELDDDLNDGQFVGELVFDPDHSTIHGSHANVRRAYWRASETVSTVAVKYIHDDGDLDGINQRLKHEAAAWMRLQSSFILKPHGFILGEEPRLVLPWCENGTLSEYLAHHFPSEGHIMELLVQVASGVDYLHSHSPPLIHGDIKPSNVVINDERSAQLCDYGLYKLAHNAADFTSTDDTIRYCAPEVARSGLQSLKADIYALANLIIYSLTGISPRLPTNIKDKRPLPRPSDHPALSTGDRLWPLLMDCLDADPSKRPPIAKVLDELEAERLLRTAAETEFQLHLTGHHLIGKHTLEVGAANEIPRKNVRKMREVALGYFADVYEGTMRTVDGAVIPVAIKSLRQVDMQSSRTIEARHERLNKRLNRENAVWGRLHHPNILPVLGVCPGTEPLLITPWMRNGSMSSYVRNSSHLAFHDKLDLILGAAQGVAYLHSLNPPICHADIKPGNVLISDDGKNALLSDFGLSLALTILRSPDATTGDPQGTRGFQAPELMFQTRRTLSGDVYSFACLILDVLTGHFPYYELAPHLAVLAARNEKMPDPALHPELPESDPLWELMQKCWVYEQYSRPDMDFIVQQLERRLSTEKGRLPE